MLSDDDDVDDDDNDGFTRELSNASFRPLGTNNRVHLRLSSRVG